MSHEIRVADSNMRVDSAGKGVLFGVPILGKLLFAFGMVLLVCAVITSYVLWNLYNVMSILDVARDVQALLDMRSQLVTRVSASFWFGIISLSAGGVGIVFSSLFIRSAVVRPIAQARDAANRIASHDLRGEIPIISGDETGELLTALKSMQSSLRNTLDDVQRASEIISSSAEEVSSGSMNLSSRTEQTAANLQQTSSTLSSMTEFIKETAKSSNDASLFANTASDVVKQGNDAVAKVVATMGGIHEASRKIAEIIAVIDGIAFQTNILALNAAVEAARAGEQGRGFAVVASEVRSLAGRSAEAAREIRSLISRSVEQVEAGSDQVNEAGQRMHALLDSVTKVTSFVGVIKDSTQAQSRGIVDLGESVQQVDQMTQQNAALVEESAAAANSLKDQANRLRGVVGEFKL